MLNKNSIKYFLYFVIILVFSQQDVFATSGNAIMNGDWDDASTWLFGSANRKPGCADTAIVPVGLTVTVNTQENLFPCGVPNIIYVYGVLQFTNGNKLDLPCNSLVIIMPGGLIKKSTSGGGNSTLISICGTVEWKAGDGPITGPDTLGIHNTLPVEWLRFSALLSDDKVNLDWVTATEINNDYFTVTRSADANTFEAIGSVDGAGNSTEQNFYNFVDAHPLTGVSYYQLRQVDFDGRINRSQIVAVSRKIGSSGLGGLIINSSSALTPSSALFNSDKTGKGDFEILSVTGGLIYSSHISYEKGANFVELPFLNFLAQGIYFARLRSDDGNCNTKFVRQ
jgi:hypothetical protein